MSMTTTKIVVSPRNAKVSKFFDELSKDKEATRKKIEKRLIEKKLISSK